MRKRILFFWCILVVVAICRVYYSESKNRTVDVSCKGMIVSGEGTIVEDPVRKNTGQSIIVDSYKLYSEDGKKCETGQIKMKTKLYPKFSYGETVAFTGKILEPMNFESGGGREFDYRNYLAKDGIFYEIKSATVNSILPASKPSINYWLYRLKRKFVDNLNRVLGEPHSALASGLVVGEKAALGKDLLDDFRTVGLMHIIVLSGYNITIIGDSLMKVLGFLPRSLGIGTGALGIILFGMLVGGGATVVRSCVMAVIALLAGLIRRDYDVTRALYIAGLIMIIENPMILLHDPSFELSFLATLGLILLAGPIEKRLNFLTERFGLRSIVASTLATQIFVSPYILYMMGQLSIIGMIVNILVLPLVPVTMMSVFLTGMSGMVSGFVSQVLAWGTHFLLSYELFTVRMFAQFPFASLSVDAFPFWIIVLFYSFFIIVYIFLKRKNLFFD